MAQVIVRNLPDEVVARLKARAAGRNARWSRSCATS